MRIIKILLVYLAVVAVFLGLAFLLAREVLLFMAVSMVKSSLSQVRDDYLQQNYASECMTKGSERDDRGRVHTVQLRYTSEKEYVVETVCHQMEFSPILITSETLPPFVKHQAGHSGFRWGTDGGLNLECLGRTSSVMVVENEIVSSHSSSAVLMSQGPPSECVSYDYQCCDSIIHSGRGQLMDMALDCPESCFEACLDRPIIVNFSTQPSYDRVTRLLQTSAKKPIIFSFMASPNQEPAFLDDQKSDDWLDKLFANIELLLVSEKEEEEQVEVVLDFGDGHQETFVGLRGQVEHQYQCPGGGCEYVASLRVIREGGIESHDGPQSRIRVQIN